MENMATMDRCIESCAECAYEYGSYATDCMNLIGADLSECADQCD